jgi:NAD(P)-dependent dehydrogenase (short-subunit alcohol dehydrogenase family)
LTTVGTGRLAGRAAVVTGASRGIGAAIARRFAAEGAAVLNASLIEPVYEEPAVDSIIADVGDPDGARRLVDEAAERLGKLDILVNNAGVELEATIEHTSSEEWDRVMTVNAKGPFLCSKFALPHLRRTRGVIVNIASVDAFWGEPELRPTAGAYSSRSKPSRVGISRSTRSRRASAPRRLTTRRRASRAEARRESAAAHWETSAR